MLGTPRQIERQRRLKLSFVRAIVPPLPVRALARLPAMAMQHVLRGVEIRRVGFERGMAFVAVAFEHDVAAVAGEAHGATLAAGGVRASWPQNAQPLRPVRANSSIFGTSGNHASIQSCGIWVFCECSDVRRSRNSARGRSRVGTGTLPRVANTSSSQSSRRNPLPSPISSLSHTPSVLGAKR